MDNVIWFNRAYFPSYIGYCPNEKAWEKTRKDQSEKHDFDIGDFPTTAGHCLSVSHIENDGVRKHIILIVINDPKGWKGRTRYGKHGLAALVAHEAVHAAEFILANMQEDTLHTCNEVRPHMVQYLVEATLDAMCKVETCKKKS